MAATLFGPAAWADEALAQKRNCLSCHKVDRKVVGPALKDIAARYNGPTYAGKDVVTPLAAKIIQGGNGSWGVVPMPANRQLSEAEAKKLAQWILSLR